MEMTTVLAIVGSAAFGAIVGKALDAWLLAPINSRQEQKKWLRQNRFESFAHLSEELISLGLNKGLFENPYMFKALAAKTVLLIEDTELIEKLNEIIYEINQVAQGNTQVEVNGPENFKIDGKEYKREDLAKGIAVEHLEEQAELIIKELGKILRNT